MKLSENHAGAIELMRFDMGTYEDLRKRALSDPELRAEYERLNREEFAALDAMLAARRAAGVTSTEIVEDTEPSAPTVE
ncbi:hypothetical protein [Burkholderia sp. AU15512]|uniref:hypothetical protein n=1 Tax=Burkholderia sp. AU15512 TaxID=2015345 RepID=UPI00211B0128|nr:hypothetical protein [Burkholderia sp. AU15512]